MAIVSPEDLQRSLIDGIQYVLDRPLRYWLTDEQKRVLKAQRAFWQDAPQATLQDLFNRFRQSSHATGPADVSREPDESEPI